VTFSRLVALDGNCAECEQVHVASVVRASGLRVRYKFQPREVVHF